jgi:transposase InsO family protein
MPGDHIAVDFASYPESQSGRSKFLVAKCVVSRFILAEPVESEDAETIVNVLMRWFGIIGYPAIISSDNGPGFASKLVEDVMQRLNIKHKFIIPYRASANGFAESAVGQIKDLLDKICDGDHRFWDQKLPVVVQSLNNRVNRHTKSIPFELFFCRKARPIVELDPSLAPSTEDQQEIIRLQRLKELGKMMDVVQPGLAIAHDSRVQKQLDALNAKGKVTRRFKRDDIVMYLDHTRATNRQSKYLVMEHAVPSLRNQIENQKIKDKKKKRIKKIFTKKKKT